MKDLSESRILIVEDDRPNIDMLVHALRNDYQLSVTRTGENALHSAAKNPPDLVLLDILMPGMDGYEVCRRLRAASQTREVPIIFLSALEDVHNKAKGFEAGGNDYLTKPFEVLEVQVRVRSLLKAKAYNDSVKEEIASELRIAREIQMGILPADVASCTRGSGLDVHAVLEPAREVGGDLYEVLRTEEGRIVIAVGDVSGKGLPAGLFMAITTTLVRTMARQFKTPEEIIVQVSDALAAHNPRDMFVTLCCAIFGPQKGQVSCASAGHPSPILLRPGCPPSLPFHNQTMVAGIFPGMAASSQPLTLQPGDTLVFYTDGVTEAFNAAEVQFGQAGVTEYLARNPTTSAADTVAGLLAAVRQHAGERPQSDDITILAARFTPEK